MIEGLLLTITSILFPILYWQPIFNIEEMIPIKFDGTIEKGEELHTETRKAEKKEVAKGTTEKHV